jgi:hypothetical protein
MGRAWYANPFAFASLMAKARFARSWRFDRSSPSLPLLLVVFFLP